MKSEIFGRDFKFQQNGDGERIVDQLLDSLSANLIEGRKNSKAIPVDPPPKPYIFFENLKNNCKDKNNLKSTKNNFISSTIYNMSPSVSHTLTHFFAHFEDFLHCLPISVPLYICIALLWCICMCTVFASKLIDTDTLRTFCIASSFPRPLSRHPFPELPSLPPPSLALIVPLIVSFLES